MKATSRGSESSLPSRAARRARAVVLFALAAHAGLGAACAVDEGDEASSNLITFPAAAFRNATAITYGQSVTLAFRSTDQFVGAKFQGKKGEVIRFAVTSARATVSYLVFDKKNLAAARDPSAPDGTFRYTLEKDGEYFVMMRSADRAASSITVKLDRLSGANGAFSQAEVTSWAGGGSAPRAFGLGRVRLKEAVLRSCVTATGCSAPSKTVALYGSSQQDFRYLQYGADALSFELALHAPPSGLRGTATFTGVVPRRAPNSDFAVGDPIAAASMVSTKVFDAGASAPAEGTVRIAVKDDPNPWLAPVPRDFSYLVSYDRNKQHVVLRSEVSRSGQAWTEYYAEFDAPILVRTPLSRGPRSAPPTGLSIANVDRVPLDDEEVISRFAPGAQELMVFQGPIAAGTAASLVTAGGFAVQACGPRTGCSPWGEDATFRRSPLARVLGGALVEGPSGRAYVKLRITGADSYEVALKLDVMTTELRIPIEVGVGTYSHDGIDYKVKVTREGLLFEAAPLDKNRVTTQEFVSLGATPEKEGGYEERSSGDATTLLRFTKNWR